MIRALYGGNTSKLPHRGHWRTLDQGFYILDIFSMLDQAESPVNSIGRLGIGHIALETRSRAVSSVRNGFSPHGRASGPFKPLRHLTPAYAVVTKGAATQRGAMRKFGTCACNPARHKHTRRGPAAGPVVVAAKFR